MDKISDTPARRISSPQARWGRGLFGALLLASGLAAVGGVFVIAFSTDPALELAAIRLGLAWNTLISAVGQTAALVGFWLVWSATRSRRRKRARKSARS